MPDLVTIEGVELASTGTYSCMSGEHVISQEDLAAAVAASQDATVPAPRLKLGHTDPRFDGELDGEPAFGSIANMRLSEDGQTLVGDYVDVPDWLAATMQSSYPSRSIEAGQGYTAPSGRTYEMALTAVALLGVEWPGIGTIADLREILEQNGSADEAEVAIAAGIGDREILRMEVQAGLDSDLVRRRLVEMLDSGEFETPEDSGPGYAWWPRSLRFEDDGTPYIICEGGDGRLYRLTFTVAGDDVTFDDAERVVEQYTPVTASGGQRVIAAWSDRDATRRVVVASAPSTPTTEDHMTTEQRQALAAAFGLPEDADEAAILEAAAAAAEGSGNGPEAPPPAEQTPVVPEGMVLADEATIAELRQGAEAGLAVAARMAREDRDRVVATAMREGRFPPSRRAHYEAAWDRDPEGTRTLLTASADQGGLATGLVPVNVELGRAGDGEGDTEAAEADHVGFMARQFPQAAQALAARADTGVRVRTEV